MTKEKEIERLKLMGFNDGVPFELRELVGTFIINAKEQTVRDVTRNRSNGVVHGMYNNLLRGVYHKEIR